MDPYCESWETDEEVLPPAFKISDREPFHRGHLNLRVAPGTDNLFTFKGLYCFF